MFFTLPFSELVQPRREGKLETGSDGVRGHACSGPVASFATCPQVSRQRLRGARLASVSAAWDSPAYEQALVLLEK